MLVDLFDFSLPKELIANFPVSKRDESKLLVFDSNKSNQFLDTHFNKLLNYISKEDILVFNNTKVIPARLFGKRDDIKIEILLHKEISESCWNVFAKPSKRLQIGDIVYISEDFYAKVENKLDSGETQLKFNISSSSFYNKLNEFGKIPIPPYINRLESLTINDKERYQTIYASSKGSVAAPTAGFHFSKKLMQNVEKNNIKTAFLTLHIGGGTFLPVKTESINDHKMHSEEYTISNEAANKINNVKQSGGRVIAVGTTSLRALESQCNEEGLIESVDKKETSIFITPGYKFKIVDGLITNFHLPKSTLFVLVSAFMGLNKIHELYSYAIKNKYRFFSYGDASLLIPSKHN